MAKQWDWGVTTPTEAQPADKQKLLTAVTPFPRLLGTPPPKLQQVFPKVPIVAGKTTPLDVVAFPTALGYGELATTELVPAKVAAQTLGQSLQQLPQQVAASVLQATQGQGGASVVNRDWADRVIAGANRDMDRFVEDITQQYPDSSLLLNLAQISRNLGYSVTSMGAGLAVGVPIAFAPVPGARVAAWTAGTAASGAVAYQMTTYQIMQQYLELKNDERITQTGRGITQEEEDQLKADFHSKAVRYGLWEAIPEAISNLAFAQILAGPLGKMVGGTIANKIVTKLAMMYGEEFLTETITQKGQSAIEVEAGLREKRIGWVEAFKEVAPQTFLLTTIMAGAGQVIVSTPQVIKKITNSLKNEIGEAHPLYTEIKQGIETEGMEAIPTGESVTVPTETITGVPVTTEPAVTTVAAETGQSFTATVYRGATEIPTDEGLVGKAQYWTTDPEYAATYGPVAQSTVELNNPFVINTQAEWDALGYRTRELRDTALEEGRSEDWVQESLRGQLEAEGYDGVVIAEGIVETGKQIAVFHPEESITEFAPTTAMVEGETITGEAIIPEKLPTTPPPISPAGEILGRSDNEWDGFMANLQDAETVADIYTRNGTIRKWANNLPGLRELFKILNPSVVANTPAEKSTIVRATLRDEGHQKTQGVIAYLNEVGDQEGIFGKLTDKGLIASGVLKGQTVGDIAQQRSKWESRLTDEQKFWLDRADAIEDSVTKFLERNEIDINLLHLEEGGQFATRRVWGKTLNDRSVVDVAYVGAGPGRPGARLPTEKARFFKTEAEAIEAGYRYIPYEEALYLKVSGAYNRVADKKMADWLLTKVPWRTTAAPEQLKLAAEAANLEKRHAQMLAAAINRAVRGERLPDVTIQAIGTSYPDQAQALKELIPRIQAGKPTAKEVQSLTAVAKGLLDSAKMESLRAVNARARAREAAATMKYGEAVIPAPAFSGKILTGPEAKETARVLRESFEPSFSKALTQVNKANAVARYFMLAGDYSPFAIQLIFLIGENPKIYGRAFGGAVRAMLDPKFHSEFLSKHKAIIDKHPNMLIAKAGSTEFTEAMARGGWLSGKTSFRPDAESYWKTLGLFLPRVIGKVGGTALTPFQRVFEYALDSAGIYMAEAYDHLCTTSENTADVDQFINEFRGLTSSARIGVSGLQRQVETSLILAPRYNRAIAGLLFDLGRGNIRGHLARKALIKGIAAVSALAVVISIARGEDEEKILDHFNPNSSAFFTWDVAGQKIGPGSKIRSLFKLVAQSAGDPVDLLKFSMDNPALRFVRGNLSPVVSSSVDLITGRSYIGDPTRDGILSFSKEILAGNLLPIWVQSVLLEGGDVRGRTWRGLAEFFGARAYPEPLWNEVGRLRDKYASQDYNLKYEELNRAQIDRLIDKHPDLEDLEERAEAEGVARGSEFEQAFYKIREQTIETRNTTLNDAATLLLNGTVNKYDYDKERGYAKPYYSGGMSVLYMFRGELDTDTASDITKWIETNQKPEDKALDEYQKHRALLIEKADLPRDWDEIESQCASFLAQYPKATREYVLANLNRWINDLPENAKKVELMRLQGIENETWWDDYRDIVEVGEYTWGQTPSVGTEWQGEETKREYDWGK